jgi:hypothetical protein
MKLHAHALVVAAFAVLAMGASSPLYADDQKFRYVSMTGTEGFGLMQFQCNDDNSNEPDDCADGGNNENITLGTVYYGAAEKGEGVPPGFPVGQQFQNPPVCDAIWGKNQGNIQCGTGGGGTDVEYNGSDVDPSCTLTFSAAPTNYTITGCSTPALNDSGTYKVRTSIPEPGTIASLMTGLVAIALVGRRRHRRRS